MSKLWLAQLLCPERHAIIAAPFERPDEIPVEELKKLFAPFFEAKVINDHCGICGSRELKWEVRALPHKSLDEVVTHLQKLENMNKAARAYLDRHGMSFDSKQRQAN